MDVHRLLAKTEVRITSWDFEGVLEDNTTGFCYLDPPSDNLYKFNFTEEDHWRLSELLYKRKSWVLSYKDSEIIRRFYAFADIHELNRYKKTVKKKDLVITPIL